MKKIIRIIGYLLYLPACPLFLYRLFRTGGIVLSRWRDYTWFSAGLLTCLLLSLLLNRNRKWLQTFSHELTHAFFSLLFLRKIHSFTVGKEKGVLTHSSSRYHIGDLIISLSPYFFPLFTFFFLLLKPIIRGEAEYIAEFFIGFTLAFHLGCFIDQTSPRQPDLKTNGIFFSFLVIFTFLSMNLSVILLSIGSDLLPAAGEFFTSSWKDLKMFLSLVTEEIHF